jgi:hypothetical protein
VMSRQPRQRGDLRLFVDGVSGAGLRPSLEA